MNETETRPSLRISRSMPGTPTSLIGRDREADQIVRHFATGSARLLTITGPGGVGKTRLAIHVASVLADTMAVDPIWVSLAAVPTPDLVLPTILQRLDVSEASDLPVLDRLLEAVQDRHLLLVLDNLEHLLACAPDLGALAAASTSTLILVTSQVPLGVGGEQVFPLGPLALPDPNAPPDLLVQSDALVLFIQRAHAINPLLDVSGNAATAIAGICAHLDGLPLAIELAAARSNVLDPVSLLARLDRRLPMLTSDRSDLPDRLRTLRSAIAWSYDLLAPDERRLFRWLTIFADGIPLAAVEAFPLTTGIAPTESLNLLTRLVNHSLVRVTMTPGQAPRYLILETLREFGHEQLLADGDDHDAHAWHAGWLWDLTEATRTHIHDAEQSAAFATLHREWENIRLALEWYLSDGNAPAQALEMCGNLWFFWSTSGMATEGRRWIDRVLAAAPDEASSARAQALLGAGHLAIDQSDLDLGERQMLASLAIAEQLDDHATAAAALTGLGSIANGRGDYRQALEWHGRALIGAEATGNQRARGVALGNLGVAQYYLGDYDAARASWERVVTIEQEVGDLQGEALIRGNLGALLLDMQEYESARVMIERALELQHELNDVRSIGFSKTNLAETLYLLGDPDSALALLDEAVQTFQQFDNRHFAAIAQILWSRILVNRGAFRDGLTRLRDVLVVLGKARDFVSLAEAAELFAWAIVSHGGATEAQTLLLNTAILREQANTPVRPSTARETVGAQDAVRAIFGQDALPNPDTDDLTRDPDEIATEVIQIANALVRRTALPTTESAQSFLPVDTGDVPTPDQAIPVNGQGYGLSKRELEVLRLLAEGISTREIADRLFIAPRTAATHVDHILGKLDVSSRTAAVALAMRLGIV